MEPALKQRLIGAAVLVALAVIFLPMLIKGPAPESGASDVPLTLPEAPQGQFETRELPLVGPGAAPKGGVVGMDAPTEGALPTVDTAAAPASATDAMQPAAVAGGDYAVSFGSYATSADAQRVVKALQAAQLPGYQESTRSGDRTLHRVRIGPYASQAEAEAARLESTKVRSDVDAKVVTLEAEAKADATTPALARAPEPAAVSASVPLNAATDAASPSRPSAISADTTKTASTSPSKSKPAPAQPVATAKPEAAPAKPEAAPAKPVAAPTKPAAADVGFAVQLGAFGNAADATKLRDRARASGFSAFVEQVRTDKGMLNRVRIGPVVSRAEADQLKAQVAAKLGVDGIVRPHP